MTTSVSPAIPGTGLAKCPSGIRGLDEITEGGLPRARPTLVCGGAGCGKTLLAMEFLVRGALEQGEPGVFLAFEESEQELIDNMRSLGLPLDTLVEQGRILLDTVRIERGEIEESGDYDLEGLFLRLGSAIAEIGATRVALDGLDALFAALSNEAVLRSELRRLFRWLKTRGVTAVITAEQGNRTLTRHGLEEYVSDCVIFLDHRVNGQIATRRLRVVKYRGSNHGTNEYPAVIDDRGLSVFPISSLALDHQVSRARLSTGVPDLDAMLGGAGYFAGSSILVSGAAGAGKSSLACAFADRVCRDGGRCLYWSMEESPAQILRNMTSIGFDLGSHLASGRLQCHAARPTLHGLEHHLVRLHRMVREYRPRALILDPISNLVAVGVPDDVKTLLMRMLDFLKREGVTALLTALTRNRQAWGAESSSEAVSSLMDTWIQIGMAQRSGERRRQLLVLKSRGMAHSHRVHELLLSDRGIRLVETGRATGTTFEAEPEHACQ